MSRAQAILSEVRARGIEVFRVGDRLRVRPASGLPPDLADRMRADRAAILAILEREDHPAPGLPPEIRWRLEAMMPQVPHLGPIHILRARTGDWRLDEGRCLSCGEPCHGSQAGPWGRAMRCEHCRQAALLAIADVRRKQSDLS